MLIAIPENAIADMTLLASIGAFLASAVFLLAVIIAAGF